MENNIPLCEQLEPDKSKIPPYAYLLTSVKPDKKAIAWAKKIIDEYVKKKTQ